MSEQLSVSGERQLTDFPDKLPAMLVKELRQGLRAPMFIAPFIIVHALAVLCVQMEYENAGYRDLLSPFWVVATLVVALVMPLRGFGALQEELESGNAPLLMLSGLTRWQIVRGKWLVQMVFCGLTFLSLLPYLIVRYFFGSFEIIPNALMGLNVLTMSAGMSGCIIGASGYRAVPMRFIAGGIGALPVLAGGLTVWRGLARIDEFDTVREWTAFWIGGVSAFGVQALYAITGLQLGRAHLKLYLLPYESAPTRGVVSLMIFLPFILLASAMGTMFYGFPVVLALVLYGMCRYDRPWRPAVGTRPQHVTGMDTGWRPLS